MSCTSVCHYSRSVPVCPSVCLFVCLSVCVCVCVCVCVSSHQTAINYRRSLATRDSKLQDSSSPMKRRLDGDVACCRQDSTESLRSFSLRQTVRPSVRASVRPTSCVTDSLLSVAEWLARPRAGQYNQSHGPPTATQPWSAMVSHGQSWSVMVSHGQPWSAMVSPLRAMVTWWRYQRWPRLTQSTDWPLWLTSSQSADRRGQLVSSLNIQSTQTDGRTDGQTDTKHCVIH